LGGVLIAWDPRRLYRNLIADADELETFLATVCTQAWNERQDRGNPLRDGTEELVRAHPHHEELIRAFYGRWDEMLGGEIAETVEIVRELREAGVRLYALSNWSAELFPIAVERYESLKLFDGILISGEVECSKPEREIFEIFCERYGVDPASSVFVDDSERNVAAATDFGFDAVAFVDADGLRRDLERRGLKWP
jgi:2-haloacid dehalogenase